jgi:hypothetical protein
LTLSDSTPKYTAEAFLMTVPIGANRCTWGALALALGACGGDVPTFDPAAANIEVTSITFGDPIEGDGYTLSLDGAAGRRLTPNGVVVFSNLESGPHTLTLAGMSLGCAVHGVNPRTVQTAGGQTAQSHFLVRCSAPGTARIIVQTFTYGVGPDHYTADLDIGRSQRLGANAELTFPAVPVGPVTLTLTGGSEIGCTIGGPNPRTLFLREGLEYVSMFKVRCPG